MVAEIGQQRRNTVVLPSVTMPQRRSGAGIVRTQRRAITANMARRLTDPRQAAEAAFKKVTTKPSELPAERPVIPNAKEQVALRIDRDVLEHFQASGPGWQDRINDALRKAAGK
jgi:uncharacterized protein (DUF4415 family)